MKLTILLLTINIFGFSQDNNFTYQYRFIIKDVTSTESAKFIQEPLKDLFKTIPTYEKDLNTFVFESKENIKKEEIKNYLPYFYDQIIYFKRNEIKIDSLNFINKQNEK